jgi:hypothetical protein
LDDVVESTTIAAYFAPLPKDVAESATVWTHTGHFSLNGLKVLYQLQLLLEK